MDKYIAELNHFLDNAKEHLMKIEKGLLSLECLPIDEQMLTVRQIFYAIYLLRDGFYILGSNELNKILYELESAIVMLQNNQIISDQKLVSLFLKVFDIISDFIHSIEDPSDFMENKVLKPRQTAQESLEELINYLQQKKNQQNIDNNIDYQSEEKHKTEKLETDSRIKKVPILLQPKSKKYISEQPNIIAKKAYNFGENSEKIKVDNENKNTTKPKIKPPPLPPAQFHLNLPEIQVTGQESNLNNIIQFALEQNFTDIYLGKDEYPRFKNHHQEIIIGEYQPLKEENLNNWLKKILTKKELKILQIKQEFLATLESKIFKRRIRLHIFHTHQGIVVNLRLIPVKIPSIEELSLPSVLRDLSDYKKGLILISGMANSGKSTTVATMFDYINHEHSRYIITIENPIEFVYQSRKSLVKQIEIGKHSSNYNLALDTAIKQNPDVIFIDCLEDEKTLNLAFKALSRGCLVVATCYAHTVQDTFEEIINFYPPENREKIRVHLAKSLLGIVSQGLCPTTNQKQTAYHDIWINTDSMKEYLIQGNFAQMLSLMEEGEFDGMITMNKSLLNLYQEGKITGETAIEKAPFPDKIHCQLKGFC